uniref:Uncharacterized protein n=1 Tax=Nelumbo nucifera TaxID=4432 RepID=A0A822Y7P8_NELNU|nr:TPA_asm: hypothetical protein HUJ06_029750 [Nelumbo nucifera]
MHKYAMKMEVHALHCMFKMFVIWRKFIESSSLAPIDLFLVCLTDGKLPGHLIWGRYYVHSFTLQSILLCLFTSR